MNRSGMGSRWSHAWIRRTRFAALVSVACLASQVSGCIRHRNVESPVPRQSASRDSLLAFDLSRVDATSIRGSDNVMREFLAADVVFLRPGAPTVFGRDNALALIRSAPAAYGGTIAWQPMGGGVSRDGLAGYTFGIAVRQIPERTVPAVERYIAYWTRAKGSPWRISAYAEISPAPAALFGPIVGAEPLARPMNGAQRDRVHAIAFADSAFADRASRFGTATAFADAIADDGLLLGPTELLVGSRAVRDYFDARAVALTWQPLYAAAAGSGDLGFSVGNAVSTSRGPTGAAVQRFNKYLTIWRREPGGAWRFVVDGANQRPSPVGE